MIQNWQVQYLCNEGLKMDSFHTQTQDVKAARQTFLTQNKDKGIRGRDIKSFRLGCPIVETVEELLEWASSHSVSPAEAQEAIQLMILNPRALGEKNECPTCGFDLNNRFAVIDLGEKCPSCHSPFSS
jgi:hypothetical protein